MTFTFVHALARIGTFLVRLSLLILKYWDRDDICVWMVVVSIEQAPYRPTAAYKDRPEADC